MPRTGRCWLAWALLAPLAACQTTLRDDLGEAEANQIALALDTVGIGSTKRRDPTASGAPRYAVQVGSADVAAALRALERPELPRPEPSGFDELLAEPGLLMTPHEERARWAAATAGELSRLLRRLPGVVDARVHLALDDRQAALDEPRPPAKAAVLIRQQAGANAIADGQVQALVAAAVDGLEAERVSVVQVRSSAPPPRPPELVRLGPFAVSRRSAPGLRALFAAGLVLDLALAGTLIALVRRRRGARAATARATAT